MYYARLVLVRPVLVVTGADVVVFQVRQFQSRSDVQNVRTGLFPTCGSTVRLYLRIFVRTTEIRAEAKKEGKT